MRVETIVLAEANFDSAANATRMAHKERSYKSNPDVIGTLPINMIENRNDCDYSRDAIGPHFGRFASKRIANKGSLEYIEVTFNEGTGTIRLFSIFACSYSGVFIL